MFRPVAFSWRSATRALKSSYFQIPKCRSASRRLAHFASQRASKDPEPLSKWLLAIPVVTFGLGTWQVQRKQWKEGLIEELTKRLEGDPVQPPTTAEQAERDKYRRVHITGTFDHSQEMLVGPKSLHREAFSEGDHSEPGRHVITPLTLRNGQRILVNRGFVPVSKADQSTRTEGLVEEVQSFEGVVLPSEMKNSFTPPNSPEKNTWFYTDIEAMAKHAGTSPVLVSVASGFETRGGLPVPGQARISIRNEHMQYILTWYTLSLATLGLWISQNRGKIPK